MTELLPGLESAERGHEYVDVAVPAPLRQRFTYACDALPELEPGMRVAVPFGRRPVAGVVLERHRREPPPDIRVKKVIDALEDAPIFPEELLSFIVRASEYYLFPIGEALRAAAPALRNDALTRVSKRGPFSDKQIKGESLATRKETFVRRTEREIQKALGKRQQAFLQALGAAETSLSTMREHVPSARSVMTGLAKRGLVTFEEREVQADPFFSDPVERDTPPALTDEQTRAVDELVSALDDPAARPYLLQGVTGSGKTEVYLHVIAEAIARGKGALVLVPEIALTPQLSTRFRARFGDRMAVLHSGLSPRARDVAWHAVREGRIRLVVGARSALFAPICDLGVIVVDEEHDSSFKQEEGFRYHAREMAMLRAHRAGAVCILGSATPSLETRHRAEQGKIQRLELRTRPTGQALPSIEIIDLERHRSGPGGDAFLSGPLHRALRDGLERGEQSILFLNRRGFSPALRCRACGEVQECLICSVSLTLHRRRNTLRCHYCDFVRPPAHGCSTCKATDFEELGVGTEQLEASLLESFPKARVRRMDRDSVNSKTLTNLLAQMRSREIDILVGTQMVTKGHDLPGVTLVGVILADQALHFPDFRAAERTFQLLSQVAGRAGRGDRAGHVFFQAYQQDHPAIHFAARHDYEGFYQRELGTRRELGYVPFSHLVAVRVDAGDEGVARNVCDRLARRARAVGGDAVHVLGPAPAPIARVRGRYRFRILLRAKERRALRRVAVDLAARIDDGVAPARAHIDVDPNSML